MHLNLIFNTMVMIKIFIALWFMCTNCLTEITKPDACSTNVSLLQHGNILPDQHIVSTGVLLY